MKKVLGITLFATIATLLTAAPAAAAPAPRASHVAQCAVEHGGQHVAECAQTMERGISECAQMTGPCEHQP